MFGAKTSKKKYMKVGEREFWAIKIPFLQEWHKAHDGTISWFNPNTVAEK